MELTGKCKEDFEKWWKTQTSPAVSGDIHHFGVMTNFKVYIEDLTDSMKYGVYVDFFNTYEYENKPLFDSVFYVFYKLKLESQKHNDLVRLSLDKCNEFYNKLHND